MLIRRAFVLASVAGLASALPAAAQTIPWLTPVNGNWSDATKWTGGNVPDASGESAVLGLTGAYTVSQIVTGLTLDAIDITNPDATLNLSGRTVTLLGAGLTNSGIVVATGLSGIAGPIFNAANGRINIVSSGALQLSEDIVNDGLLTVNLSSGASTTTLSLLAPVSVTGSGAILLNSSTTRGQITAAGGGASLTNGPAHTIRGFGQITAPMTNNGTVSATVAGQSLFLNVSPKTNNGLMRALGGALDIVSIAITQGASGVIRGEETLVTLNGATVSGGSIDSTGAGRVRIVGGTSSFSDVDSTADVEISSSSALVLSNGYTNDRILLVNLSGGASTTTLRIDGPVTIDGTGEIRLNNTTSRAQIIAGTDGVLTLGAGQFVHGLGQISVGGTNNGIISADVASNELLLNGAAKVNNGVMEAAGGILGIVSIPITQGAAGEVVADGSEVRLNSGAIVGGEIASINGGLFRTVGGTSTLDSVVSSAAVVVNPATILVLEGSAYINDGLIDVNPVASASTTSLQINEPLTIGGNGSIRLGNSTSRAQIIASGGADVTFGPGQVVHGLGQIVAPATNHGQIVADFTGGVLDLNTNPKTNTGSMTAAGGTLSINAIAVSQSGAGEIVADNSLVQLVSASITGGEIGSIGSGVVRQVNATSTLRNLTTSGLVEVNSSTELKLQESIENNATIVVNANSGSSTTSLVVQGEVTVSGNGGITLNNTLSRAQISPGAADAHLNLGPGQTLRGVGQVAARTTIEGTVSPGLSVGTLTVSAPATPLTWEAGSSLDVEIDTLASFDRITGGSHTINGGTVDVTITGAYTPALFDTFTVIDGAASSVVTGKFDGVNGPALPPPWVWRAGYTANDVIVGVTCPSDVNADFTVDILDFLDFFDAFGACENQPAPCGSTVTADYNGDTFVDILDFLDFFDAFGSGC